MVTLSAGAVVLIPFPFSDLSQSKLRPAIVLSDAGKGDWIAGQGVRDQEQRPRAEYWQPAGWLFESLLASPHGLPDSTPPQEAEKVWVKLRKVRALLNRL